MFLGRVVGEVWATHKASDLAGLRLLVVQALDERREPGAPKVTPVVAADPLGAAFGQRVIVAFGKAARVACGGDGDYAFEAAIVGIVDDFDIPDAPPAWHANDGGAPRTDSNDRAPRTDSNDRAQTKRSNDRAPRNDSSDSAQSKRSNDSAQSKRSSDSAQSKQSNDSAQSKRSNDRAPRNASNGPAAPPSGTRSGTTRKRGS
jgi:ethanolamine utilization protein EutN